MAIGILTLVLQGVRYLDGLLVELLTAPDFMALLDRTQTHLIE